MIQRLLSKFNLQTIIKLHLATKMKIAPGNTLKDSFYKERLIKSSANSMYNTFNRTSNVPANDSDQDLPQNMTIMTNQQDNLDMKNHLKDFKKTSEGPGYAFVKLQCTHKMLRSMNKIRAYQYLEQVDLSYNKLKSLKYLSGLRFLLKIKATNNQLTSILDVKKPPLHLDWIDVSNNAITKMNDLSGNKYLRVLNLKANQISVIEGINKNLNLEILDLSENKIEEISGLDGLNLKQLNLSSNLLEGVKGMTKLESLRILDLSVNKIRKLSGLVNLISLRTLKMAKNNIKNVRQVDYLQNLMYLSHLDFCYNPIQQRRYYRSQVIYKLLMLQTLDGTPLSSDQVIRAEDFYGLHVEQKFNIFKKVLPQQQFIDRRIHKSELLQNQTDSDGQQNNFIDQYDEQGKVRSNSSRSKNKSFNASKRSAFSRGSKLSKKSSFDRS